LLCCSCRLSIRPCARGNCSVAARSTCGAFAWVVGLVLIGRSSSAHAFVLVRWWTGYCITPSIWLVCASSKSVVLYSWQCSRKKIRTIVNIRYCLNVFIKLS
jgi:hypothetical protein